MTKILIDRATVEQALEALELYVPKEDYENRPVGNVIDAFRAALAEPTVKESLQVESAFAENATTQQQLEEAPPSDYRRGYWDGFEIGKREGRIEAENALAELQEPVAYVDQRIHGWPDCFVMEANPPHTTPLYTAPPQRPAEPVQDPKPLTEEEIDFLPWNGSPRQFARAVERAHGIGVQP